MPVYFVLSMLNTQIERNAKTNQVMLVKIETEVFCQGFALNLYHHIIIFRLNMIGIWQWMGMILIYYEY